MESIEKINKGNNVHASEDIGTYYCVICSKNGIATKKDLRRHLKFAHEKDIARVKSCRSSTFIAALQF